MKLQKGDVVRLAQSVTTAEFGLALCDDEGAGLERRVLGAGNSSTRQFRIRAMSTTLKVTATGKSMFMPADRT